MDRCLSFAGTSVAAHILNALHAHPGRCAMRYRDLSISNGLLLHKIQRFGAVLQNECAGHQARVGVCIGRCPDVLVILLALWSRGAIYVPLDPALPRERLLVIAAEADLDLIITQTPLQPLVELMPFPALVLEPEDFDDSGMHFAPIAATEAVASLADDLAYILFTSGSSGIPKGVMISHRNLAVLMQAVLPLLLPANAARVLACASFSFDVAFFELLAPLLAGGTVVLADQDTYRNPELLTDLIRTERVNVVQATPTLWQLLNRSHWQPAADDFIAISTGEALPRAVAQEILARTAVLWNLYGPTECTIWASAHRVQPADVIAEAPALISIGTALPGYRLRLQTREESVEDDRAELVIEGAAVGHGYCYQPALSAKVFSIAADQALSFRSYRSGDLCRLDAGNRLHFCGRHDNQVKHNGYRIELDEIAALLQLHSSIRQAVCLLRDPASEQASLLFACVVPETGMPNKNRQTLNQYLARSLPGWMLPQRYYFLDTLPLMASGKVDRATLLTLTRPPPRVAAVDDSLQNQVAGIFCEVLEIDAIGPCDSFFDAGGSSMLGATLVMMLNAHFTTRISMHQALLSPPTVLSITRLLETALGPEQDSALASRR